MTAEEEKIIMDNFSIIVKDDMIYGVLDYPITKDEFMKLYPYLIEDIKSKKRLWWATIIFLSLGSVLMMLSLVNSIVG